MAKDKVLRQQVYEKIKHDIITCKLEPGGPISESQFVDKFKVSKTPIREALTSLVQDGLVEYMPNRGFMVRPISVHDIQEIFEARVVLESALFRMALSNITDTDIDLLESDSQVRYNPNDPGAVEKYLDANHTFHLRLATVSHNRRLIWQYTNLLHEAQRLFYMDFTRNSQSLKWGHGHERIIEALRKRDEEAGIVAIKETLQDARKRILGA
jgi:DNA-binding GntR family transcriptional regulator